MRPLGALGFLIVAALAVWLAVANRSFVTFSVDAMNPGAPGTSMAVPLFGVLLIGVLAGLIGGGIYMISVQRQLKREIRQERERAEKLQAMIAEETLAKMSTTQVAKPALVSRLAD